MTSHEERLVQDILYGGRRTIDVAPVQAPVALTDDEIRRMADENPCPECDGRGATQERPDADGNWDTCDACDGSGVKDGL